MATSKLCNHWTDMPEWYPGRRLWAFYLTFADQVGLQARVHSDQQALRVVPGIDMIATDRLHLSVQGIAFVDQVEAEQIEKLADVVQQAVARQGLPTFTVVPAEPDYDAFVLPVFPVEELTSLKKMIRTAAVDMLGPDKIYQLPESQGGFSPHISIAYAYSDVSPPEIAVGLRGVDRGITEFNVRELSLVALRRESHTWFWDYERRIPFDAGVLDSSGLRDADDSRAR